MLVAVECSTLGCRHLGYAADGRLPGLLTCSVCGSRSLFERPRVKPPLSCAAVEKPVSKPSVAAEPQEQKAA